MKIIHFLMVFPLMLASIASAEMEKFSLPGDKEKSLHSWPKLPKLKGWHQDRDYSVQIGSNALAPDGFKFNDAETVMYAKAIYKPREKAIKSLDMLIENDKKDFTSNVPGLSVEENAALKNGDGKKLRTFTYSPKMKGNWERVSYGEEGDFYVIFTLSSRSASGFLAAAAAYEKLIKGYKAKP